jgi:hypothetical protein
MSAAEFQPMESILGGVAPAAALAANAPKEMSSDETSGEPGGSSGDGELTSATASSGGSMGFWSYFSRKILSSKRLSISTNSVTTLDAQSAPAAPALAGFSASASLTPVKFGSSTQSSAAVSAQSGDGAADKEFSGQADASTAEWMRRIDPNFFRQRELSRSMDLSSEDSLSFAAAEAMPIDQNDDVSSMNDAVDVQELEKEHRASLLQERKVLGNVSCSGTKAGPATPSKSSVAPEDWDAPWTLPPNRNDFVLQIDSALQNISGYVGAIRGHTQYWSNVDMAFFILEAVTRDTRATATGSGVAKRASEVQIIPPDEIPGVKPPRSAAKDRRSHVRHTHLSAQKPADSRLSLVSVDQEVDASSLPLTLNAPPPAVRSKNSSETHDFKI